METGFRFALVRNPLLLISFLILVAFPLPGAARTNRDEPCNLESDYFELATTTTGQSEPLATWKEANDLCSGHNMTLPILSSTAAHVEFERFIQRRNLVFRDIWLGARLSMADDWRWLNGSAMERSLQLTQVSNCPNNQSNHGLVRYNGADSYIFGSDCSSMQHNFICQYDEGRPKISQPNENTTCRSGGERCLIAYTEHQQLPWYLARNFCLQRGGDLATDINAMKDLIPSSPSSSNAQYFWIGLSRTEWKWTNDADVMETFFRDDIVDNFGDCLYAVRDKHWLWDSCPYNDESRRNLIVCQKNRSIIADCPKDYKPDERKVSAGLLAGVVILAALDVALVVIVLRLSKKLASRKCRKERETGAGNHPATSSRADSSTSASEPGGTMADYSNEGETTEKITETKQQVFTVAAAAASSTFPADRSRWAELAAAADASYLTPSWLRQASVISSVKYETFIYTDANSGSSPGSVEVSTRIRTGLGGDPHVYVSLNKERGEQGDWVGSGSPQTEAQEQQPGGKRVTVTSPVYANNSEALPGRRFIRQTEGRTDRREEPGSSTVQVLRAKLRQLVHPPGLRDDGVLKAGDSTAVPRKVFSSTAQVVSVQEFPSVPGSRGKFPIGQSGGTAVLVKRPETEKRDGVLWTGTDPGKTKGAREKLRSLPSVPGQSWSENESAIGY